MAGDRKYRKDKEIISEFDSHTKGKVILTVDVSNSRSGSSRCNRGCWKAFQNVVWSIDSTLRWINTTTIICLTLLSYRFDHRLNFYCQWITFITSSFYNRHYICLESLNIKHSCSCNELDPRTIWPQKLLAKKEQAHIVLCSECQKNLGQGRISVAVLNIGGVLKWDAGA